ncbi:sulfur carrier protein ThiS [Arsukibacterium indicum]|uniref:Sulfur carrier protein ThiS n=1 Tax=Arsukibacterium indicum TaxID=2848612 RepID=A0ABS6MMC4_9GAMM|nr:sulfur carrier protein ThiS [Arsukibacterium indicum]MBV2129966.1 sulfur carrier protein ThiS [Arsukibacterium indicum]
MHIRLNEQLLQLTSNCTVAELLQQQQLASEGLAVAINNTVISKRCWSEHKLQSNDNVQLFQIVTGG